MMIYDDTSYLYHVCVCQCTPQGCWYGTAVKMKRDAKNKTSPIPFLLDDENFRGGATTGATTT